MYLVSFDYIYINFTYNNRYSLTEKIYTNCFVYI